MDKEVKIYVRISVKHISLPVGFPAMGYIHYKTAVLFYQDTCNGHYAKICQVIKVNKR